MLILSISPQKDALSNICTISTRTTLSTCSGFSSRCAEWPDLVLLWPDSGEFVKNLVTKRTESGHSVKVLEKGPQGIQGPVMTIIHCLLHYVDMSQATQTINADLLRTVARFIEVSHKMTKAKLYKYRHGGSGEYNQGVMEQSFSAESFY